MSPRSSPPRLGLNRWDWRSPEQFAAGVARAEMLGWDDALLPTNPVANFDPYVLLAGAAMRTTRIRLAPFLDNPVLRHPAVLASAITTVDAVSGGRARLVLGVGDTAVRFLGLRPAKVAELEAAVSTCRRLLAGEKVDVECSALGSPVPAGADPRRGCGRRSPAPCAWPGEAADGVFLRVGRDPMNLGAAVENLRAEARPRPAGISLSSRSVSCSIRSPVRTLRRLQPLAGRWPPASMNTRRPCSRYLASPGMALRSRRSRSR